MYDIHRVLLHEYGHVLGLAHSGTQSGMDIMEPVISDVDHPFPGDVAGVRHLYGASFSDPPGDVLLRKGYSFAEDVYPNNNPTSLSATGLPPGIAIDVVTGRLQGAVSVSGTYPAVITAHGPIADVSEGYKFTILDVEDLPGLLAILPADTYTITSDPIRPLVYTVGGEGVRAIDSETFKVTDVTSQPVFNPRSSIAADNSTLLYTDYFEQPAQEHRIDLNSLTALPDISIPGNNSRVLEGLNNRAYVAGRQ